MMIQHICDLCWLPFFCHKDPQRIKLSRFYLLWGVRYQHLCDFHTFKMYQLRHDSVNCVRIFAKLEIVRAGPKIFTHAKNQPWGSSSLFNQLCIYKHTLSGQKYFNMFKLCHMVEICMQLKLFVQKITSNVLIYLIIGLT